MNIRQIKETCLYVTDLDRTQAFYHGKLGFPIIGRADGRHVFFRAGSSVLLCFIAEATRHGDARIDTKLPPHYGSGHLHLAFEVAPDEYEDWKAKIRAEDIIIIHEQMWKPGKFSFYFHDPDGHVLEILPVGGIWE